MLLAFPISAMAFGKIIQARVAQSKFMDKRLKKLSEMLQGVRVLKYYAWEAFFSGQVHELRMQELAQLRRMAILRAVTTFSIVGTPLLVSGNLLGFKDPVETLWILRTPLRPCWIFRTLLNCTDPICGQKVTLATFGLYTRLGNKLTPEVAFPSLLLFQSLIFPLTMLPMIISNAISLSVALKRLDRFMQVGSPRRVCSFASRL
jgi:ABC-type multidrug transport system fused ATPase/permease subunit